MSDALKRAAAAAALDYVERDSVLGVGTGSTVNAFIDLLGERKTQLAGAVSSSDASTSRLQALGIPIVDLNESEGLDLYVDGADEVDSERNLIKGGGGALTREKIVAEASARFVCIVDESKCVAVLGAFPLPIEVIPMARRLVERRLEAIGGRPTLRAGFVTDNGNQILDVHGLQISAPAALERDLNQIPGIVAVGIFARRKADVVLAASNAGVSTL